MELEKQLYLLKSLFLIIIKTFTVINLYKIEY